MDPFVSVTKHKGEPVVQVRIRDKHRHYPLTAKGCRQAGHDLYHAGAESWMNSSSVDFPQEVKKGCRLDVRELMGEGFQAALTEYQRPQKELVEMMLAHCEEDEFQQKLTAPQKALFKKIAEKTRRGDSRDGEDDDV
jgi:hypothetical protein